MRAPLLTLAVSLALLGGCIAAPPEIDAAAVEPTPAEPGLLAAPRVVPMPAGTSFAVVKLDATPEDWVEWNGDTWLFIAYEFPESVEAEATGVSFFGIDGTELRWSGSGAGNGAGRGASGRSGDPEATTLILGISVVNASEPFDLRLGVAEEIFDDELQGEPLPANVLASGPDQTLSIYFEFGSVFSLAFGGEPWTTGVDVQDSRIHPPVGSDSLGLAGTLQLDVAHPLPEGGVHNAFAFVSSFQATRVGTWSFTSGIDGEKQGDGGIYAEPAMGPWITLSDTPSSEATATLELNAAADVFPITIFQVTSFPWDPATLGLTMEPRFDSYSPLPVPLIVHTPDGCIRADAPAPPSREACVMLG